jgi:hypothetical protein
MRAAAPQPTREDKVAAIRGQLAKAAREDEGKRLAVVIPKTCSLSMLRRFSPFHHGIPGERWLRALVNRVDPLLFGRCFESWIAALWPNRHDLIAIDGKTARRSGSRRHDHDGPLHLVSAWASAQGLAGFTHEPGWR